MDSRCIVTLSLNPLLLASLISSLDARMSLPDIAPCCDGHISLEWHQKAIKIIFDAAQNKVAAEQGLKKGSSENKKAAIKETERAVETQPNWDIIYRSPLTSSPNVFLRGSLMFQSARNAQMNVLMRSVDDFNKGRIVFLDPFKHHSGTYK